MEQNPLIENEIPLESSDAGRHIRMHRAAFNLRPAVDTLLEMTKSASTSLRKDQPLVILLGEKHIASAHIAFQLLFLQELHRQFPQSKDSSVFCAEYSCNHLEQTLERYFDRSITPELRGRIAATDKDGQRLLSAFLATNNPPHAPLANHTLFDHCRRMNIKTGFTDAARFFDPETEERLLDQDDHFTAALIQKHAENLMSARIDIAKPDGMRLRNIALAENALQFAQDFNARIIIQKCGRDHLFGNSSHEEEYRHSLSAVFRRAGAAVLPVLITTPRHNVNMVPAGAKDTFADTLLIEGMADDYFSDSSWGEIHFLEYTARQSGADIQIFDPAGNAAGTRATLRENTQAAIPSMIKTARVTPPHSLHGFVPAL